MLFGCWYPRVSKHRLSAAADCACWHLTKLYRDWGKLELYKKHLNILPVELQKKL